MDRGMCMNELYLLLWQIILISVNRLISSQNILCKMLFEIHGTFRSKFADAVQNKNIYKHYSWY